MVSTWFSFFAFWEWFWDWFWLVRSSAQRSSAAFAGAARALQYHMLTFPFTFPFVGSSYFLRIASFDHIDSGSEHRVFFLTGTRSQHYSPLSSPLYVLLLLTGAVFDIRLFINQPLD